MKQSAASDRAPRSVKPWLRRMGHVCWRNLRGALLLEDTAHRIALGSAVGMSVAFLPILGQVLLAALIARVVRANVLASLPWTFISNPLTTLPLLYGCYRIGRWLTPGRWELVSWERLHELLLRAQALGWSHGFSSIYAILKDVYVPMFVGGIVVGAVTAVLGYGAISALVGRLQARRDRLRAVWRGHAASPSAPDHRCGQNGAEQV